MEKKLDLSEISDEELLKLLKNIEEHLKYLNDSVIVEVEGEEDED